MVVSPPYIVIRAATARDLPARLALLHAAALEALTQTFLYFFFQEVTLECVVLCGAVLFIFCGVSAPGCALLLPATAALLLAAVRLHVTLQQQQHAANMRNEMAGWVAELRGPLGAAARGAGAGVAILMEHELDGVDETLPLHTELVGTVSVAAHRDSPCCGWVRGLCVARGWRRRGAGRALLAACGGGAGGAGLAGLAALVSGLQGGGRALLGGAGWRVRAAYRRPLLGAALSLPVALLSLDLPPS